MPTNENMSHRYLTYSCVSSLSSHETTHLLLLLLQIFSLSVSSINSFLLPFFFFFFFSISLPSNPLFSFSCVLIFPALIHTSTQWQWVLNLKVSDRNKLKEKKSNTKTYSGRSLHFGRYSPKSTKIAETHRIEPKFVLEFVLMGFVCLLL